MGARSGGSGSGFGSGATRSTPAFSGANEFAIVSKDPGKYTAPTADELRKSFESRYTTTKKDGTKRMLAAGREEFGTSDMDKAFKQFQKSETARLKTMHEQSAKIHSFEKFLHMNANHISKSTQSKSTYYQYKGTTFRFSDHWYPTGSMTQHYNGNYSKVDFVADPQLITKFWNKKN